ncbi:MAG TPA: hypothetical protein VF525_01150 [Pyrinomonadaceae bacterium]|jgi:hypothetical protein
MNCQQVETWLVERADGAAGFDATAAQHLAECMHCAARVRAAESASAALRALAAEDAEVAAPAHVEATLRAAFRAQTGGAAHTASRTSSRAALPTATHRFMPRRAFAALTVAAAIVLLVVAAQHFRPAPPAQQTAGAHVSPQSAAPAPQPQPASGHDDGAQPSAAGQQSIAHAFTAQASRPQSGVVRHIMRHVAHRRPATRPLEPPPMVGSVGEMIIVARAPDAERVTEFVPLVAGGAPPLASGQLVRVELPRSALAALGLALDPARAGETIKADVLLGDDGLARAIRLVR